MPKIAIVAAMEREVAPLVRGWKTTHRVHGEYRFKMFEKERALVVICGGMGAARARSAASAAIVASGAGLLVSAGYAGALKNGMKAGDPFQPATVVNAVTGERFQAQGGSGTLVSVAEIAGAQEKRELQRKYNADAADMEAAFVAEVARTHNAQFASVKAISDELEFALPEMKKFVGKDGKFKTGKFALSAAAKPGSWSMLRRLGKNARIASETLSRELAHLISAYQEQKPAPKLEVLEPKSR